MQHKINIEGIRLYAFHGCLPEEEKIGCDYIIHVSFETDFTQAAESDDLKKTIDYCEVFEICKAEMAIRSKLIEHVGLRIFKSLRKKFPEAKKIHLKLAKLLPPVNGAVDSSSIEIID
ncbi:MAG: dihydroneopterin aldolase [Sphingobacteriaceae bacterium]|nr:dihydroneopterin aldolase [Sphingobacteriaceae bacterium]